MNDITKIRSYVTTTAPHCRTFAATKRVTNDTIENKTEMKTMKSLSIILLLLLTMFIQPSTVEAQINVGISIGVHNAPPALPYYTQPYCPVDGYMWTPGYWAYADEYNDYYWVPGDWVRPPQYGFYWTPCYWGFSEGYYRFHNGYWGPNIGYYGGVNYGYGYYGSGFQGGRWKNKHFEYNTAAMNVNRNVVHNTYVDRKYIRKNNSKSRPSYNGPGGERAMPNARERVAMNEKHAQPTSAQATHQQTASKDRSHFASENKGRPANTSVKRAEVRGSNSQGSQQVRQQQQKKQPVTQQQQGRQQQQQKASKQQTQQRQSPQKGNKGQKR